MIIAPQFAARAAVGGTIFLAAWVAGWPAGLESPVGHFYAAAIEERDSRRLPTILMPDREPADAPQPTATVLADAAPADLASPKPVSSLVEVATVDSMSLKQHPEPAPVGTPSECPATATQVCIDDYLWALYERAPKIDTNKVVERVKLKAKVIVREKKKTRTVTKTFIKTNTKYVLGDFTWKDPNAARKAGMSLKDYVIGGMDPGFKLKLYRALRAMDDAGHMPGITSAFRDDYRQSIASGHKASSDSSYHGGSRRGGYGHGLAADLVSVNGENRSQRYAATQELWKWIDAHEKELGIARPYLDRDPPHVAPLDGAEYAAKRGRVIAQTAQMQTKKHDRVADRIAPAAKVPRLSKVSSLQLISKARERASKKGQ